MSSETTHARLKRATSSLHLEVERALPLVSPGLTLDRYREVLQLFHGFYAPHEERMTPLASRLPFPLRHRTGRLARDLLILGVSAKDLEVWPRCETPALSRIEQLAGWLYVFEGASLGGQVVARFLRENLGLEAATGAAFFAGDGVATIPRWRQVLGWIEGISAGEADPEGISAAACETFTRLRTWIEQFHGG